MASCPAHEDSSASLSVTEGDDGRVLLNCFAGCPPEQVVAALGLHMGDLFADRKDRDVDEFGTPIVHRRKPRPRPAPVAAITPKPPAPDRTQIVGFDVHYPYFDADGTYLYSVLRWNPCNADPDGRFPADPKKQFRQRIFNTHPDTGQPITGSVNKWSLKGVRRVPYRLPETVAAVAAGHEIWFVEGEKDVHTLLEHGHTATTSSQGADGFQQMVEDGGLKHLAGGNVVVWPDNDNAGRLYAANIIVACHTHGINVAAVVAAPNLPNVKDATDYLTAGHNIDDLSYDATTDDPSAPDPQDWAATIIAQHQLETAAAKTATGPVAAPADAGPVPHPVDDMIDPGTGRPMIVVTDRGQEEVVNEVLDHLIAANDPPIIFEQMGGPVRLRMSRPGRPTIEPHTTTTMSRRIGQVVDCVKIGKKGPTPVFVPKPLADLCMSEEPQPFQHLESVSYLPILSTRDNRIHFNNQRGYDPESFTWYEPLVDIPDVADNPTDTDLLAARDLLAPLFAEFPFDNDISRAHAWAALFTPLMRNAVNGPTPLNLVTAPKQGSGKSFLPELVAAVSTGEKMQSTRWETDDTEMSKILMALLLAGQTVATFDNQTKVLRSNPMANMITSGTLTDRRLGHNDQSLVATNRCTWFVTGNNLKVDTDFNRRVARIRLDTKMVRPESRKFKNRALDKWALTNRGNILHAMLTIIRSWSNAGCPPDPRDVKGAVISGFDEWVQVIGGVVHHGRFGELVPGEGCGRLLDHDGDDDSVEVSDEEANDEILLHGLLRRWSDPDITKAPTWADIDRALLDGSSQSPSDYDNRLFVESLPAWITDVVRQKRTSVVKSHLESMKDRPYGENSIRLAIGKNRTKTNVYLVESDTEPAVDELGLAIAPVEEF